MNSRVNKMIEELMSTNQFKGLFENFIPAFAPLENEACLRENFLNFLKKCGYCQSRGANIAAYFVSGKIVFEYCAEGLATSIFSEPTLLFVK